MTNAAVATIVKNFPDITHVRLCIMNPYQPDSMTYEPMYEAFGCRKLRKLEIRDCPFENAALLFNLKKYESMRSLWMSACNVTMNGGRIPAKFMPRFNR
ncbi:hypothetical protein DCAR_0101364 [Daucus carota subsp. sativus]|uniref:Uncharacterized protein n=1 Tax=Daucus carota subsp. sativus TaxID=79200 RepID=A0AAF1AJ02_DAUCS|nr:hypothetical protein DCAR_0101364 [Daucus carota subsp. sativus]